MNQAPNCRQQGGSFLDDESSSFFLPDCRDLNRSGEQVMQATTLRRTTASEKHDSVCSECGMALVEPFPFLRVTRFPQQFESNFELFPPRSEAQDLCVWEREFDLLLLYPLRACDVMMMRLPQEKGERMREKVFVESQSSRVIVAEGQQHFYSLIHLERPTKNNGNEE